MREIKYRAWDKSENQMARSVTELLFNNKGLYGVKLNHMGFEFLRRIKDVEIMQYTGLKDKNGKEIYEGDICKYYNPEDKDGICEIKEDYALWISGTIKETNLLTALFYLKCSSEWEIIGNIHENPELLER